MGDSFVQRLGTYAMAELKKRVNGDFRPPLGETEQTRNASIATRTVACYNSL